MSILGWLIVIAAVIAAFVFYRRTTVLRRDAGPERTDPGAVAAVGMFDGSLSNIDDTDHVGGSSIIAVFGDRVRLRVSDVNLLPKSALSPATVEIGKPYHAVLSYD